MSYSSLADFVEALESQQRLIRISDEVDSTLEITEITRRATRELDAAVFFERVAGHEIPLVTNLLGSPARIAMALGVDSLQQIEQRVAALFAPAAGGGWVDAVRRVGKETSAGLADPKSVRSGVCQQVIKLGSDIDLSELPTVKSWPEEARGVLTGCGTWSQDPQHGIRNVGLYPVQILGRDTLGLLVDPYHGAARHLAQYRSRRQPMPVALVWGGNPAHTLMAATPLPAEMDECHLGGLLLGKPLELVSCRSHELEVPADSEMVIEGYIDPPEGGAPVGPLAGGLGHYRPAQAGHVVHVSAVTHRVNPILTAIVAGPPPHESAVINATVRRFLFPAARRLLPELLELEFPSFGGGSEVVFARIEKRFPHQARKVAAALWGLPWMMLARLLVIVDGEIDLGDTAEVWRRVVSAADPRRDFILHDGPAESGNRTSDAEYLGHQLAIDATSKLTAEQSRGWPHETEMPPEIRQQVERRWAEWGWNTPR
jgi:4-hydroxy-3-polyprenylbenzoate decarboxylase